MQVRLWHESNPLASVVNLCYNAIKNNVPYNLHFFVNSVDFIGRVLRHAQLSPEQVKVVCSQSGASEQINREKLGGNFPIGIPDKEVRKINFYTSTAFEGCDLFDAVGKTYVVSDGTAAHHLLDVSTSIRQIAGRIRDTQYKEITHIFSTVRYAEDTSYPQFKAATERELDKAERFVKWYGAADEDVRQEIYTNHKYINTDTMTIDRNRIKLELLNFRNNAEIYADTQNLITEYERNGNEITATEQHDIRLTRLEKNANAKIPFKELFDQYTALKQSEANPFSADVFTLSLIARRNPLVKQAFEELGAKRVAELKYNQTQIRRELIKRSTDCLAYKIAKRISADLVRGKAIPTKVIKEKLQAIYDDLGIKRTPKATDLAE